VLNYCTCDDAVLSWWSKRYYQALNHPTGSLSDEIEETGTDHSIDSDVMTDAPALEIKSTIRRLKNGHAPRADDVPSELLKCAIDPVVKSLLSVIWSGRLEGWHYFIIPSESVTY